MDKRWRQDKVHFFFFFFKVLVVEIAIPFLVMEKWYGPFSDLALIPVVQLPLLSSPPFISVCLPSFLWLLLRLPSDGRILGSNYFPARFEFFQDSTALKATLSACDSPPLRCHQGSESLFCLMRTWPSVTFHSRINHSIRIRPVFITFCLPQWRRPPHLLPLARASRGDDAIAA